MDGLRIMQDVSKCPQHACPKSATCWRFRAPPGGPRQVFTEFPPGEACRYYINMTPAQHTAAAAYDEQQRSNDG
jgi:hypothetical protein